LREIWDALKKLSIDHLSIAGIESEQLREITKDQKNILKTLRTPITKKDKEKMSRLI
jgi:hypothetical protein